MNDNILDIQHRWNAPSVISVFEKHNLTFPANAIEWRVKDYIRGKHVPLFELVFLIATDGNVAWFTLGDRKTLFFGQLKAFVPDESEAQDYTGRGRSKGPSAPSKLIQRLTKLAEED